MIRRMHHNHHVGKNDHHHRQNPRVDFDLGLYPG